MSKSEYGSTAASAPELFTTAAITSPLYLHLGFIGLTLTTKLEIGIKCKATYYIQTYDFKDS